MASNRWESFRKRDSDVLESFRRIGAKLTVHGAQLSIRLAAAHQVELQVALEKSRTDQTLVELTKINGSVAYRFIFDLPPRRKITVQRPNGRQVDEIEVEFQENAPALELVRLLEVVSEEFPQLNHTESIERILGPDIANFYRDREEKLVRLENLSLRLVEESAEYRRKLDAEAADRQAQRDRAADEDREQRKQEFDAKLAELTARQKQLDDYKASLDDRQSKHARRHLREELQRELRERSKEFKLTNDTMRKRISVHALFGLSLAIALSYLVVTIVRVWDDPYTWLVAIRTGVGVVALAAILLLYIRWMDLWFREHADEEFRLKRLGLDIDRASWVVETSLEWQQENEQQIPAQLLEQLTRDLFAYDGSRGSSVRHPIEDLGAAVLSNASSMKLKMGEFGEVVLNQRGARKVNEAMNPPKE